LLLARRGIPVAVARDRLAAGRLLLAAHPECDLIIADDGLQHYRLARDVEIAVIDEARRFGNGWLLPAGPLREPVARLDVVAAVVVNGAAPSAAAAVFPGALGMTLVPGELHRVDGRRPTVPPPAAGDRIHAVAGIGDPLRFFRQLRALGLDARYHAFPDHHGYLPPDLAFGDELPIVMTEKDAVKCVAFASERCWYLPVEARLDPSLVPRIEERLRGSQAA
jgi:tetraacyldisaccharide 4'-kinase